MARVYKVSFYVADYNDHYGAGEMFKENLEVQLEHMDVLAKHVEVEESEEFEWEDDLAINKTKATKKDFQEYFKQKYYEKEAEGGFKVEKVELSPNDPTMKAIQELKDFVDRGRF